MGESNCISKDVCDAKMNMYDERCMRQDKQLDKYDENLAKLNEVSIQLNQMIAIHTDEIKNHGQRITQLEHRPGRLWDKLIGGVIGAVSGGFAAAVIALVLK